MANNAGQYVPTTTDYIRLREVLHGVFSKAVDFAHRRHGRVDRSAPPLPEPQEGAAVLNPARGFGPAFGNQSTRRFLF